MTVALGSAYGQIEIGTGGAEQAIASLASTLRSMGTTMSLAISAPLTAVAGAAIASASDFEQSMNIMQQVSGATAGQMESLQATALQLGAETSFSAGEAASAMLELAKAGLSVDEVSAAIGGTMNLAAAGGLALAQSAEITANAVNSFGLEASQANMVANMLAAAANASSVEVTDLAQGMAMAGSVFASNGQSVTDLTAALGLLGNAGIKGSDAGTSLKTMMMRLAAPTDDASAAMTRLGIETYNADGSMRPFSDIVGNLATATAGLSDEERNAAMSMIFGADAIRAATILSAKGVTGFAQMTGAVSQQGAAADVANARMKGMSGAIEYLKGFIDSFLIGAALPFLDTLGGIVRSVADAVTAFGALPQPVINAGLAFGAVLAAAGPVMLAISGIGAVLGTLLSPIGLIVVAVAGLAAAWSMDFMGIQGVTMAALGAIQPMIAGFGATVSALGQYFIAVAEDGDYLNDWLTHLPEVMQGPVLAIGQFAANVRDALPGALATGQAALGAFSANVQAVLAQVGAILAPAVGRIQTAFASAGESVGQLAPHFAGLVTAAQSMATAIQPMIAGLAQALGVTLVVAASVGGNLFAAAIQNMAGLVGPVIDQITATINLLATTVSGIAALVSAVATGDWSAAWAAMQGIAQGFADYFESTFTNVSTFITTVFTTIKTAVLNTMADLDAGAKSQMDALRGWWDSAWNALTGAFDPVKDGIQTVADAVQKLKDGIGAFADWIGGISIPNPFAGIQFPALPAGFQLPGFASGTAFAPGGLALVGERGPELIDLPRGSRVYDANETRSMLGGSGMHVENHFHVTNDLDLEAAARRILALMRGR
jgi:TP901 family phage tail tape measure protein